MRIDQTLCAQTWIAKVAAKCLRADPRIALLVSGNLETTEARGRYDALNHQTPPTLQF